MKLPQLYSLCKQKQDRLTVQQMTRNPSSTDLFALADFLDEHRLGCSAGWRLVGLVLQTIEVFASNPEVVKYAAATAFTRKYWIVNLQSPFLIQTATPAGYLSAGKRFNWLFRYNLEGTNRQHLYLWYDRAKGGVEPPVGFTCADHLPMRACTIVGEKKIKSRFTLSRKLVEMMIQHQQHLLQEDVWDSNFQHLIEHTAHMPGSLPPSPRTA